MKINQEDLVSGLLEVFRKVGYDGASLTALAAASGLKKSSLYHRFPGGKQQMAQEVLEFANEFVSERITGVLMNPGDPATRLHTALHNIDQLYAGGQKSCLLRALSMDAGLKLFSTGIQGAFTDWIKAFVHLGTDLGMAPETAHTQAENVVIQIQGSLIVARGTDQPAVFKRTLTTIENTYLTFTA